MATVFGTYPAIQIDGATFKEKDSIKWYESRTLGVLKQINGVATGEIVLKYLQSIKAGRKVTIKPYNWAYISKTFPKDKVANLWNATAQPKDHTKANDQGQSVILEALKGEPAGGTDVEVYFTKWVIDNPKYRKSAGIAKGSAGSLADEILLHELVHGVGQMLGRDDRTAMADDMHEVSEFRSILVTNIYATDASNPVKNRPVRKDHAGTATLTAAAGENINETFLKLPGYRSHTQTFIRRFPGLAWDLLDVNATFNPVRALIKGA